MCKEMPIIPVNWVVGGLEKNNLKNGGQGGGEAQGDTDP
jgi:hypothetical protein